MVPEISLARAEADLSRVAENDQRPEQEHSDLRDARKHLCLRELAEEAALAFVE